MNEETFDVAVLGAGPGGYTAAIRASDLGASVVLIECGHSGGTCLNVGCIPTKAMLHASELFWQVSTAGPAMGIDAEQLAFDLARQVDAKDKIVARLRGGLDKVISTRPIERVRGYARLAGPGRIAVFDPADRDRQTGELSAGRIILATGSRPVRPSAFAFDDRIVTTDEVLSLRQRPARMIVLGGGVNGCEQATFFAEIGTQVTVVEALDRILPALDEDISREVAKALKKRKVQIHAGRRAESIVRDGELVRARLDDGTQIVADIALIVIGRRANTDDIGLKTVGLSADERGCLPVDDRCATGVEGVYAVGDVTGVAPYAHVGFRQGEVAAANAAGGSAANSPRSGQARDDMRVIPAGIFTHPEVATVGLSESAAAEAGCPVKLARFPLQALGIAQAQHLAAGWVKLIVEPETDRILGAAVVSPRAVEVIHELALAVRRNMTVADIGGTIHAHPTYSEAVKEAADHYLGLPIHGLKG